MKKILIVGSANVDLSIHVKQIPAVGETVLGKSMERLPGGKGANQACAVGKLGGIGCFLCAVGSDDAGLLIQKMLEGSRYGSGAYENLRKGKHRYGGGVRQRQGREQHYCSKRRQTPGCDVDYLKAQRALFHDCDLFGCCKWKFRWKV